MFPSSLKSFMRNSVSGFGARLPINVLARLVPRDVIVLMYHATSTPIKLKPNSKRTWFS